MKDSLHFKSQIFIEFFYIFNFQELLFYILMFFLNSIVFLFYGFTILSKDTNDSGEKVNFFFSA